MDSGDGQMVAISIGDLSDPLDNQQFAVDIAWNNLFNPPGTQVVGVIDLDDGQQWRLVTTAGRAFMVASEVVRMPPSWKPRAERRGRRR